MHSNNTMGGHSFHMGRWVSCRVVKRVAKRQPKVVSFIPWLGKVLQVQGPVLDLVQG